MNYPKLCSLIYFDNIFDVETALFICYNVK